MAATAEPSQSHQRRSVSGLCVFICSEFDRSHLNYGALDPRYVHHNPATNAETMSTLVPRGAETVTVITTEESTFLLFPEQDSDDVFYARPRYAAHHCLGAHSVVHGWLYTDKRNVVRIGLFDASRIKGVDLRTKSCLERHTAVHELLHEVGGESCLHYHWSGHEAQCMRPFHTFKLHFDISGIARLTPDLGDSGAASVVRVLPRLLTAPADLLMQRNA